MKTKSNLFSIATAALTIGVVLVACSRSKEKDAAEKPAAAEAPVPAGADGEKRVALNEETQQRIGLATETLVATNFLPTVKGYGRVLDPTPLTTFASDLAAAQLAATASRQELARLKILKENASEKALQTAEATAKRDELAVGTAQTKLKLTWGKSIAGRENLFEFLQPLLAGEKILVRINLPAGSVLPGKIAGAVLTSLASAVPLAAEFIESAPQMDEQMQGQGLLFLAASRADFPPGAAVTGFVQTEGEPLRGMIAPRSAIVRHEGKSWMFFATDAGHFTRREMNLEIPMEGGWFVSGALTNRTVVVSGAQILLSEESKDQIGAGE
ncbi:MAG: hypothetical protein ABIQ35_11945 [Verrucomicrobiota bacterium]